MNPTLRGMVIGMAIGIFLANIFDIQMVVGVGTGLGLGSFFGKSYEFYNKRKV